MVGSWGFCEFYQTQINHLKPMRLPTVNPGGGGRTRYTCRAFHHRGNISMHATSFVTNFQEGRSNEK